MASKFEVGVMMRWRARSRLVCWCKGEQDRGGCVLGMMASKFEDAIFVSARWRASSRLVFLVCDAGQVQGLCVLVSWRATTRLSCVDVMADKFEVGVCLV